MIWLAWLLVQDPQVELEVRASSVHPKFRLRDGEKALKGQSVFSRELDAEDEVLAPGAEIGLRWGDERFHASFWRVSAEGSEPLEEAKAWGGAVVPAGTIADSEVLFRQVEIGWRHRFILHDNMADTFHAAPRSGTLLWLDAGADLEWMVVDAELGFGGTRLGAVYPAPQLEFGAKFWGIEWLELAAGAGGFFLPFKTGDTSALDPIEYRFEVRARLQRTSAAVGYDLTHVHLEEDSGRTEEDVVHLRLRGIYLSLAARF